MAVYTELSRRDCVGLLTGYDLGELADFRGIAEGVENTNYLLETGRGKYILTLYERRVKPEDLPFFLAWMEHLAASGVPCPLPVHARDGSILRDIKGRPGAMVTFLEGRSPRVIQDFHCRETGNMLARMHRAAETFSVRRDNAMGRAEWPRLAKTIGARADEVRRGLAEEIADALEWLDARWPDALPAGVIHADLFPDNVFFRDEYLTGVIDFYFACTDFFAYDLAIALNAWCFEHKTAFNITKAGQMLAGYQNVRPLAAAEREALPVLAAGAAMRFLLSRLYDWLHRVEGALVTPKDPLEYLEKLRFHRQVRSVDEYGV